MMQACAGAKRVVFMTVTGPYRRNNPLIRAGVARYRRWPPWPTGTPSAPTRRGSPDHVHVGPAGAAALGNLLASVA